jgi:hypothetical protein
METFLPHLMSAVVGGAVTGIASFAAIRVHLYYLRRDINHAHTRIDNLEGKPTRWAPSP